GYDVAAGAGAEEHQVMVGAVLEIPDQAICRPGREWFLREHQIGALDGCPGLEALADRIVSLGRGRVGSALRVDLEGVPPRLPPDTEVGAVRRARPGVRR